jgi:hypothetical protein
MHLTILFALLLAMPGQTVAQLMTWGAHNPGLVGFKATLTDLDGGGTDYITRVHVDGYHGQFHAMPKRGIVRMEYVSFEDTPDAWHFEQHGAFVRAVIRRVYGNAIASDFARKEAGVCHIWGSDICHKHSRFRRRVAQRASMRRA